MDEYTFPECVGCGYCCKTVQCLLSYRKFCIQKRCPALRFHDGRYWCGLVEDATDLEKVQYITALHIGAGCSSDMNSERRKYVQSHQAIGGVKKV
jgi:hypothetical protein